MKISFIGYGHIAQAMAQGLANQLNYQLRAAAPSLKIGVVEQVYTHHDNLAIVPDADIIIIAVKPIHVAGVLTQIKQAMAPHCLLISLAAGLSLSWLEKQCLDKQAIVRAMPNMPIAVHKGATPLIANQFVSREQQEIVTQLFQSIGLMIWVSNEDDINIFTALSGSGPAYIFLFLEAMIHAAQQLGLQEDLAQAFALQTVSGAVELAKASALTMDELRKKVTSPGGTTAAAIQVFKEQKFEEIVSQAMHAAFMRSKGVVNEID